MVDPRWYIFGDLTFEQAIERLAGEDSGDDNNPDYRPYMEAIHFVAWHMEAYIKEDKTDLLDWLEVDYKFQGNETAESLAALWDDFVRKNSS